MAAPDFYHRADTLPSEQLSPRDPPAMNAPFHGSVDGHFGGSLPLCTAVILASPQPCILHHSSQLRGRYILLLSGDAIYTLCRLCHRGLDQRFSNTEFKGGSRGRDVRQKRCVRGKRQVHAHDLKTTGS